MSISREQTEAQMLQDAVANGDEDAALIAAHQLWLLTQSQTKPLPVGYQALLV